MSNPRSNFGYFPEYTGSRIYQLGDVKAENPDDGDVIQWSSTKKEWVTGTGTGGASNSWKGTVRAATTSGITLSGLQTVDGVSLVAGDRILVKNQGVGNGIYIVSASTWERSTDLAINSDASGAAVFVNSGTVNGDTAWFCTNDEGSATVGTDSLLFSSLTTVTPAAGLNTQVQFNSSGSLAANSGLTYNSGSGTLTSTGYTDGSAIIQAGNITIQDTKELRIGTNSDFIIDHDGSLTTTLTSKTGNLIIDNTNTSGATVVRLGSDTSGTNFIVQNNSGSALFSVNTANLISASLPIVITDSTQSTSHTTGSIITFGGVGIGKDVFCNGAITATNSITGGSLTDGVVNITGGAISNANNVFTANMTTTTGATNLASGGGATLGLYGVTPITRPTTGVSAAAFVANTSGISNDSATYGGYTMGQVVQALKNIGALT